MDRYATLRNGLVGAWCPSLTPGATIAVDRTGRGANTAIVSPVWSQGAVLASASGGYISPPVRGTFGASATLSVWIKRRTASPPNDALSGFATTGGPNSHFPFSDGLIYSGIFRAARVNGVTPIAWVDRTSWFNFCITTDGTRYRIYQSGFVISDVAAEASVALSAFDFGRSGTSLAMDGQWDDVRLYNRALTQAEVFLLASQRAIGLLPTRHRRANTLGSQFWLRDAGAWKKATPWIRVNGVWTKATPKLNVGGTWK